KVGFGRRAMTWVRWIRNSKKTISTKNIRRRKWKPKLPSGKDYCASFFCASAEASRRILMMNCLRPLLAGLLLFILGTSPTCAASSPMLPAQPALYQGGDRERILINGAKREGQLTLYDSHTWFRTYVKEFEKKYPFITVSEWRNDS